MAKKQTTDKKKSLGTKGQGRLLYLLLFVVTGAAVCGVCVLTDCGLDLTVRNTLVALGGALVFVYLCKSAFIKGKLDYDNQRHPLRLVLTYLLCLALMLGLTRFDMYVWPITFVYVLLNMVSERVMAFYGATFLMYLSFLLVRGSTPSLFLAYTAAGACAVTAFSDIDKAFIRGRAVLMTLFAQVLSVTLFDIFFRYTPLSFELFVLPLVNLAVSALLLLILTAWFSSSYLRFEKERYTDINDPGFSLMTAIRSKDKEEYMRAVHGAYLTQKCAVQTGVNTEAAKTLAYYKRIGCLDEKDTVWEEVRHYFVDFEFPEDAQALLKEYLNNDTKAPLSKEGTIVRICDDLVVSLQEVFRKNKDAQISYDDTIDRLFAGKTERAELSNSDISVRELEQLKVVLKQEKLYYDFLR